MSMFQTGNAAVQFLGMGILLFGNPAIAAVKEDVWELKETNSAWQAECGSCHMAFPPALLTQDNWKELMSELEAHFGVNASLDADTRNEITAFLASNAGTDWSRAAESLRITETGYFAKRHAGGIRMLEKGRIKSLADCLACHK